MDLTLRITLVVFNSQLYSIQSQLKYSLKMGLSLPVLVSRELPAHPQYRFQVQLRPIHHPNMSGSFLATAPMPAFTGLNRIRVMRLYRQSSQTTNVMDTSL